MDIKEKIKKLPDLPGVYLMKDKAGKVIYVGKAKSLKKRLSSYLTKSYSLRTMLLMSEVEDVDYIQTGSEAEALIYEANLIKRKQPKFNVELKDDKSYPYLKLTINEEYPGIFITRRKIDDGARYYGPYTDVKLLKEALSFIKRVFPIRTCKRFQKRVCVNYHLSECLGPCTMDVDKKYYNKIVDELILFLEGERQELLRKLSKRMEEESKKLNFEEALQLRNRIRALGTLVIKRGIPSPMDQIEELRFILNLKRKPKRIEAFDISDIHSKEAVGSLVSFYNGKPDKDSYRRFRVKTVKKIDDYKMMREVIHRRYKRLLDEKGRLPDLIIIDGGKGHLGVAIKELKELGLSHIPVIGIAKEFEHIYVPDKQLPIILPKDSSILQLIKRIRDEAHRFAKSYHTRLRRKRMSISMLDAITGVGKVRKKRLLKAFGSVENIRNKGIEELVKIDGIDEKTAKRIVKYFKNNGIQPVSNKGL